MAVKAGAVNARREERLLNNNYWWVDVVNVGFIKLTNFSPAQ